MARAVTDRTPRGGRVIGALIGRIIGRRPARLLARHHARTAIAERIRAGAHVGAVPYGYRIPTGPTVPTGPHQQMPWRRQTLIVDEATAPVVAQIFTWRATDRIGATIIARRLDAAPDRYPPPRGTGCTRRRWTRAMVRHILADPVHTGRRAWGRTHHGRPTPVHHWIVSARNAHPALIDDLTFHAAQQPLGPTRSRRG